MQRIEGVDTEFKREFSDEIKKTAVAFANANGGKLYVGVEDDGTVVGINSVDFTMRQITDSIRNSVKPDLTRFIKVDAETIEGKTVVVVTVGRGVSIPYYLAERGLKPSGVYIRVGSASVPATEEHIRHMIKEADSERYIAARSLNQDLSFERTQKEFAEKKIAFGDAQKRSLGLINETDLYTNLGLLLSEQCEHTTKIAVFEGNTKTVFKSRKEFGGSLIEQLYNIIEYLDYFNFVHAEIGKVRRTETRDYPIDAIREAVLNSLLHREYGLSASTFINVYDNRMEFLTVGGLVPGITVDAILSGISYTRNEALANVFYRLELVEAYGTGLMRIMENYVSYAVKPEVNVTDSSFMLTLPNMRFIGAERYTGNDAQVTAILQTIERDGFVTPDSLTSILNLGKTRCYNILKQMCADGKIAAVKNGRRIEYRVNRN